jgi:hypothetical protein
MIRTTRPISTLALVAAFGCGGRASSTTAATSGMDGGGAISAQVACDDFMTMGFTNCVGTPTAEMASLQAGFGQACQNTVALPGSGVTPAALEACAAALNALPCQAAPDMVGVIVSGYGTASFLEACNFRGSLAAGAPCNENFQCASALCSGAHQTLGTEGPLPSTCGMCAPTAAIGESCSSSGCGPGALCSKAIPGLEPSFAPPDPVCVAVTYGALGASCDANVSLCAPGLSCTAGHCVRFPGNVGDSCSNSISCAGTLVCQGTPQTCQQPVPARGSCSTDQDCAYGLVCEQMTAPGACVAINWVMPGEPCGAFPRQCLVGSCDYGFGPQSPPLADGGVPTCPIVIPNGQPCGGNGANATCDTYSECFNSKTALTGTGVCTPIDGNVCR